LKIDDFRVEMIDMNIRHIVVSKEVQVRKVFQLQTSHVSKENRILQY